MLEFKIGLKFLEITSMNSGLDHLVCKHYFEPTKTNQHKALRNM